MTSLGELVRGYLERVVNAGDLTAVEDLVDPGYVGGGHGWPADRESLRAFYADQARSRPDWRIDVQESIEAGEWVAVRALAGGTVAGSDGSPRRRDVEWLAAYRVIAGRISEIRVLELRDQDGSTG